MRNRKSARLVAFAGIAFISISELAVAQTYLGEIKNECLDREMRVWGRHSDIRLFRGRSERIAIDRDRPVVWFCGRDRREFDCTARDRADELNVIWEKGGLVLFQCFD